MLVALNAVVRDHGWLITTNPARLRAALSDVLGPEADQHRGLVDAIVVSAEEGVPAEIRAAGRAGLANLGPPLTARLVDWGMADARARWVVDAWGSLLPESTLDPPAPPAVSAVAQPPPVEQRSHPEGPIEPTALPPAASPYLAPTMLPLNPAPRVPTPGPTTGPGSRRRRLIIGVAAALLVALGGGAAAITLTGNNEKPASSASTEPTDEALPPASGSELVLSSATVTSISPVIMGGYRDGVALVGLSPVTTLIDETGDTYAAPDGGSLVGFRLAQGDCELQGSCRSWQDANLSVDIDGRSGPLPTPGTNDSPATFVAAVPAGARSVALVMKSDGHRQSISLTTGAPSSGNIAVLARDKRFWTPRKTFRTTERVTIDVDYGDGIGRRSNTRRAEVPEYSLQFWANRKVTASTADRALLRVRTFFHYPQDENPDERVWYWRSDEVQFRDAQNRLYRPVRMPSKKDSTWYDFQFFFDVPASITSGTLLLGGSIDVVAGNGTPYIATTPITRVPLRLR